MSIDALIEALQHPISPAIIERALQDIAAHELPQVTTVAEPLTSTGAAVEVSGEWLAAEIARLDASSKRTFRRRYRKLCKRTRELVDLECLRLPSPADVPADHRGEAYFHDADEHYANTECGYCLLEVLHDGLRQSRCECGQCNGLRSKHLHYAGACRCDICQMSLTHAHIDAQHHASGRYVIPVTAAAAAVFAE